jgi:hypothetical protein
MPKWLLYPVFYSTFGGDYGYKDGTESIHSIILSAHAEINSLGLIRVRAGTKKLVLVLFW